MTQCAVVNWFQIVFLREDSQGAFTFSISPDSCELISNCIFTWGFTRTMKTKQKELKLWIDFKLYFYVRIHKKHKRRRLRNRVVNWFQIVFLREDSQDDAPWQLETFGCELISNCIFTWGFTSDAAIAGITVRLWIDFKLYFYVRIHKSVYCC